MAGSPVSIIVDGTFVPAPELWYVYADTTVSYGTPEDNDIRMYGSNLTLFGGAGNDTINGAINTTAGYTGLSNHFDIQLDSGSITVRDLTGAEGTDTLTNVAHLQFSDQTIDTSWLTKAVALPSDQTGVLVDLYTAYFNRTPDAVGLDYIGQERAAISARLGVHAHDCMKAWDWRKEPRQPQDNRR
jgi:hypothetical protein